MISSKKLLDRVIEYGCDPILIFDSDEEIQKQYEDQIKSKSIFDNLAMYLYDRANIQGPISLCAIRINKSISYIVACHFYTELDIAAGQTVSTETLAKLVQEAFSKLEMTALAANEPRAKSLLNFVSRKEKLKII